MGRGAVTPLHPPGTGAVERCRGDPRSVRSIRKSAPLIFAQRCQSAKKEGKRLFVGPAAPPSSSFPPGPDKLPLPLTSWFTVLRGAAGCRRERRAVRSSLCVQRRAEIFPRMGIALHYEGCFLQSGAKCRRFRSFVLSFCLSFFPSLSEGTCAPLRKHLC